MSNGLSQEETIEKINDLHRQVEQYANRAVMKALEAGRHLVALKEVIQHGKFEDTIKRSCTFSLRTAQLYMRMFYSWPRIEEAVGAEEAAKLSIKSVMEIMRPPAKKIVSRVTVVDKDSLIASLEKEVLALRAENERLLAENVQVKREKSSLMRVVGDLTKA